MCLSFLESFPANVLPQFNALRWSATHGAVSFAENCRHLACKLTKRKLHHGWDIFRAQLNIDNVDLFPKQLTLKVVNYFHKKDLLLVVCKHWVRVTSLYVLHNNSKNDIKWKIRLNWVKDNINISTNGYGTKYSRIDQVKFVEASL